MQLTHTDLDALAELIAGKVKAEILAELSPGRWMTVREAMEYCRVKTEATVRKWIREGYIYAHKRTGEWLVDRQSIDDWLNGGRIC